MTIFNPEQIEELAEAYRKGATLKQCGHMFGISFGSAKYWLQKHGIELRPPGRRIGTPQPRDPVLMARNVKIKEMFLEGQTLEQIGSTYGITRERVRQVLLNFDITGFDGGASVQWERNALARHEAKEEWCQKRYGCSVRELSELRRIGREMVLKGIPRERTPIGAYHMQRHTYRDKGVQYDLKLGDFWSLWRDSGKWEERGQGKYGLCRKDTSKGFTKDNVFIRHLRRDSQWGQKRSGPRSKFKPVP